MMTIFTLLLSVLLPISETNSNLIEWEESRKLSWSDFQGAPDPNSTNAALTNTSINAEFGFNKKELTYSIRCRFNKSKSWVRVKSDYILAHEQAHFDITEIFARKLHKALKEYRFNERTVGEDVNRIYESIMKGQHAFQIQYDAETDHSRIPAKQKEWETKIAGLLKEYSGFKNYAQ